VNDHIPSFSLTAKFGLPIKSEAMRCKLSMTSKTYH
jgi:hypothetical protein